jgi:antitoxin ParD1/3/4
MTTIINIALPDSLKAFVDQRVKARGYDSHSEYLRDLVRKDEVEAAKDAFRALVAAGLASPSGREWGEFKAELVARAEQHRATRQPPQREA